MIADSCPRTQPSYVCFHFANKIYSPLTLLTLTPTLVLWLVGAGGDGESLIGKVCINFTATRGKILGDKNQQICQNQPNVQSGSRDEERWLTASRDEPDQTATATFQPERERDKWAKQGHQVGGCACGGERERIYSKTSISYNTSLKDLVVINKKSSVDFLDLLPFDNMHKNDHRHQKLLKHNSSNK